MLAFVRPRSSRLTIASAAEPNPSLLSLRREAVPIAGAERALCHEAVGKCGKSEFWGAAAFRGSVR